MGINQRVSLRKFIDDIRRWVEEDRSDEWIASALEQALLRCNRSARATPSTAAEVAPRCMIRKSPSYEGVLEPEGPGIWFDPEVGNDPAGRSAGRAQRGWSCAHTDQDGAGPPRRRQKLLALGS